MTAPEIDEIYSVSYVGGSSGQFIRSMIVYMIRNDNITIDFTDGSSHHYASQYAERRGRLPLSGYGKFVSDRFTIIQKNATIEHLPLVVTGGLDFVDHELYSMFPKFKCVLIKVDIDDALITSANHYYKNLTHNNLNNQYYETYIRCVEAGILRPGLSSISELDSNEMILLLETRGREELSWFIPNLEHRISTWPIEHADKLFTINFKDITDDPKQVIETLENITNVKMSDAAIDQYYCYAERQRVFRKEYGLV